MFTTNTCGKTLDAVVLKGSRGPRRLKNLCLDKGYNYKQPEQEARASGVKPHIRRRGEPALTGRIRGKKPTTLGRRTEEQLAQQLPSTMNQIGENRGSLPGICSSRLRSHHQGQSGTVNLQLVNRRLSVNRLTDLGERFASDSVIRQSYMNPARVQA